MVERLFCEPQDSDTISVGGTLLFVTRRSEKIIRETKAYIPLRRKKVTLGPGVGLAPQRHYFAYGIPTCWYLKMLKFAFPPTQNPVGHVHFIYFVLISFALGSRRKRSFQWNMGLSSLLRPYNTPDWAKILTR